MDPGDARHGLRERCSEALGSEARIGSAAPRPLLGGRGSLCRPASSPVKPEARTRPFGMRVTVDFEECLKDSPRFR